MGKLNKLDENEKKQAEKMAEEELNERKKKLCYCKKEEKPHKPKHSCCWDLYVLDEHSEECASCPKFINRECTEILWTNCPYWRDHSENAYY